MTLTCLLALKKRGFGEGRWNGPGGKLQPGESVEQALVREVQEEISVTPLSYHKVAVHDFILNTAEPWHMYTHVFFCRRWEGEPTESEEMAPRWFKLAHIPYDQMWSDDIVWLPLVLQGKLLHTIFRFDADEAMTHAELTISSSAWGIASSASNRKIV